MTTSIDITNKTADKKKTNKARPFIKPKEQDSATRNVN